MKWIASRPIARRLLLLLIAIVALASSVDAQKSPSFLEGEAFSGGLLKPSSYRMTGFGLGVGRDRNFVGIEVHRELLSDYEFGVGTALDPGALITGTFTSGHPLPQNAISGSRVEGLNGSFRRDLYSIHGKVTAYGLVGGGYLKALSTESYVDSTYMNGHLFQEYCGCNPASYSPVTFGVAKSAHTVGLTLGSGLRIPLGETFGLRAEFNARFSPSLTATANSPGVAILDATGNPFSAGGTPVIVGKVSGSTSQLKAESFLGITIGVYYRIFNRHL